MVTRLSDEIKDFHTRIRARALLIAIEWAGSANKLSRMCGVGRAAGNKWAQRGYIPPLAALSLSLISGFPLTFEEMCPGEDARTLARLECPHCWKTIRNVGDRTGSSLLLMARSESRARKHAARSPKRKRRAANSSKNPPFSRAADCDLV